jgi:hypothetical protein
MRQKEERDVPKAGSDLLKHRITERFRTDRTITEIKELIGEQFHVHHKKFSPSELTSTTSGLTFIKVHVSKQGDDCLIVVDHNMPKTTGSPVGAVIVLTILAILVWMLISGWLVFAVIAFGIWVQHLNRTQFTEDKMEAVLKSIRDQCSK